MLASKARQKSLESLLYKTRETIFSTTVYGETSFTFASNCQMENSVYQEAKKYFEKEGYKFTESYGLTFIHWE